VGSTPAIRYDEPGLYTAHATALDGSGTEHDAEVSVLVGSGPNADARFQALWNGLFDALEVGDRDRAMAHLTSAARERYQPVFDALLPYSAERRTNISPLFRSSVSADIGEYAVERDVNGETKVFLIYFLRSDDGVWRIDAM
jgi:hypothetical protein